MNFDHIIMNPPYDDGSKGMGHIDEKILFTVLSSFTNSDVVSLQPCNLVVDPYKMLNSNKLMNRLTSFDIISKDDANHHFNIGLSKDLAIYHFGKENDRFKNLCAESLTVKILSNTKTTLNQICNIDKPYKIYILRKTFGASTPIFWEYDEFKGSKSQLDYYVAFDTMEEKINFLNVQKSKLYKYIYKKIRFGRQVRLTCVPVLPTYTHPWTDEMLYQYFDLTEDEVNEIEQGIK